jgi:hypothetical protein
MVRSFALAAFAAAIFCALPVAHAQDDLPELDGSPPPLKIPKPALPKPVPAKPTPPKIAAKAASPSADLLRAEEARLKRQAEAQKTEQLRLDRQAAGLKSEQASLDARAAQINAEERRLAQLRIDQEAAYTQQLAELGRQRTAPPISEPQPRSADLPATPGAPRAGSRHSRINYESARRACTRAGMDEALDRDFYSARYQSAPRLFERELRGIMRLDDSRGYLLVDTICELDDDGRAVDFVILR